MSDEFQSPFRRGSDCNYATLTPESIARKILFQSPFRRGSDCNVTSVVKEPSDTGKCFNPLFAGAVIATQEVNVKIRLLAIGFNPLFAGAVIAT